MCEEVRVKLGILTVLSKVVSLNVDHYECVKLLVPVDYP
jgi:hypothetical protein